MADIDPTAALSVDINIAAPDPNDCPANFVELIALLDTLISGTIIGNFLPYVTGTDTPGSDDRNKVWHRLDTNGKPIGTFLYFNGAWRRQYSGRLGQMSYYSGDPEFDFDDDGRGRLEGDNGSTGEWDGWHLCNGEDGTLDLSDKFIVVGRRFNNGRWETDVSGTPTTDGVGVHEIQMTEANTFRPATGEVRVGQWEADNGHPAVGGLIGLPQNDSTDLILIPAHPGNPISPAVLPPLPTLPPYYALALVVFIGYA